MKGNLIFLFALMFAVSNAYAADPPASARPDSGTLLQQAGPQDLEKPKPAPPEIKLQQPGEEKPAGPEVKILVSSFKFTDNKDIPEAELQKVVSKYAGKELTLDEMKKAAEDVTEYYRKKGYPFARAILPPQQIKDGVVEIKIVEARFDKIEVDDKAGLASIAKAPVKDLKTGKSITNSELERALLLLNELPGVDVKSTLKPGATPGASDLLINITPGKAYDGNIYLDNFGSYYSGPWRLGGDLYFNNPFYLGDRMAFQLMGANGENTGDTVYGRFAYQSPLGYKGLKGGLSASFLTYALGGDTYKALNANGTAGVLSASVIYPIIKSNRMGLYFQSEYDYKNLTDNTGTYDITSMKHMSVGVFGLLFSSKDDLLTGGVNTVGVGLTTGDLMLNNYASTIDNSSGANTAGSYTKIQASFRRDQFLGAKYTLSASIQTQYSLRGNLDSSEKMQLGGISGVRAFPANEFFCDDAELVTVELSRSIWKYISAGVFYDIGSGYANHYNYSNSSNNQRTLQDVGFNITAMKSRDWAIKGTAAFKLYNDPNQSQPDNSWQGWIQAVKYF